MSRACSVDQELGRVYNLVDDSPASRAEVMAFARSLLGLGKETAHQAGGGETGAQKLGSGEKRVRNTRMKEELGVVLRHPDYKSGLLAIHGGDQRPFAE